MKFHCPKCRKQFLLSAKLAGKTIKVRCTSCGSVFRMRVTAGGGDDHEPAHLTAEDAPVGEPAQASAATAQAQPLERPSVPEAAAHGASPQPASLPAQPETRHADSALGSSAAHRQGPVEEVAVVAAQATAAAARAAVEVQAAPAETGHRYFAVVAGKRLGPMPYAALKRLIQEQKIHGDTLVWRKGLDEWLEASQIDELAPLFSETVPAEAPAPARPVVPPPLPPRIVPTPQQEKPVHSQETAAQEAGAEPVKVDETTGEEVHIEEMDHQFFALGQVQQPSLRGAEEIQLGAEPMFPLELEEQAVEKGARASLKDFSVMVRLSKRSRTKHVTVLVGLFSATALAVALIFTLGDPLGVIFPEKQLAEEKRTGPSGFYTTVEQKKAEKQQAGRKARPRTAEAEQGEDPGALLTAMQEKEWHVSVGDDDLDVDRGQIRDKLKEKKSPHSGDGSTVKKAAVPKAGAPVEDPEEISLEEYARRIETRQKDGSLVISPGGKGKVADSMDSAMGDLMGGPKRIEERKVTATVKERESDGVALKAIVARYVAKKVGAERKSFQRCVDSASGGYAGTDGRIKATLHFTEQGTVDRVSVPGAPAELEQCFTRIFDGWRIATVNQKVKIPIAIRFE